jgi:Zn-dependent peptidase ImmA (M78 family)
MSKQAPNVQALASSLLKVHQVESPPVDVQRIAEGEGLRVTFESFEDNVSGVLVQQGANVVVGVNIAHHPNRQRFTIAHELAHYKLHPNNPTVYVDDVMFHFRGESLVDQPPQELEANAFAAALLMPEDFLRRDLQAASVDALDENAVKKLAHKYGVSTQALTIRLMHLGLLSGLPNR